MISAINAAYERFCRVPPTPSGITKRFVAADLERLRSAMLLLDPDCDDPTWKFRRIAILARLARDNPDMEAKLCQLARDWSSGALRGEPSKAWTTPGQSNGRTGEEIFDEVWERFLTEDYAGQPTTLGTIFHDAKEAGWIDDDAFKPVVSELESALSVATHLLETVKTDVGAPFEPDAIKALTLIRQERPADYQRFRSDVKKANRLVSVVDLDAQTKVKNTASMQTHNGYAKEIIDSYTVDGWLPVGNGQDLWVYNSERGLWEPVSINALARVVADRFDGQPNCRRTADYQGIANHVLTLVFDPLFFSDAPVGLACPKGFYRIEDNRIVVEPLSAKHRQRVMIPVAPDPMSTLLFDGFLHETFQSSKPEEEAQQVRLIQEIVGAIMLGLLPRYQKAGKFYDPYGRAGKGTLERIIRALVPSTFVTAVSPFDWDKPYFIVALAGSRLNVVGELPQDKAIPAAAFKSVLGGDLQTGRHPAERTITFKNEAAHLFMSNYMIYTKDHSEAFFARWLLVEFPNSRLLSGLPIDPDLAERIIGLELPGIAHWALEGAVRLLSQDGFSSSIAHDRLMAKWRRTSNSLEEFIHDACEIGSGDFVTRRSHFYKAYDGWCKETGRRAFSKGRVKELLEHNIGLGITLKERNGHECFLGVQLQDFDIAESTE